MHLRMPSVDQMDEEEWGVSGARHCAGNLLERWTWRVRNLRGRRGL